MIEILLKLRLQPIFNSSKTVEMMAIPSQRKAYLFILLGVLLLGSGPLFVKSVNANGVIIAFYRLLFASLMMAIPALVLEKSKMTGEKRTAGWIWPLLGGLTFALNISLWSLALKYTTASAVTLLDNTAPVWVGLFNLLVLKERRDWKYWLGVIVSLTGAALMIGADFFHSNDKQILGNWLGIASGVFYAAYLLVTKRARSIYPSLPYSWRVCTFGAIILFLANVCIGGFDDPPSNRGFFLIFLMAFSSQVVAWLLINQALGELPASILSIVLVGQPVVTTLLGILFLNEVPQAVQLAGGACCLGGILLVQLSNIHP